MAESTGIAWCDATFNPWIGCEKVSPGCAHCYAETLVHGRMGRAGTWGADGIRQVTSDSNWKKPLRWARLAREGKLPDGTPNLDGHRPRVFCASLADVFEDRPELEAPRDRLFELIAATPELDWLVLTKRPEFAHEWLRGFYWQTLTDPTIYVPLPNVWLGVSIENARHTWRADVLREIPAAVRFLSCEPLLGSLFEPSTGRDKRPELVPLERFVAREHGRGPLDLTGIDWVIVGGESGPGARPMRIDWAREILEAVDERRIVHDHEVALFVKQLGSRPIVTYDVDGHLCSAPLFGIRDRKGGDWGEWEKAADLRIREFPTSAAVPA